jgi:hypothetical protein
MSNGYSAKLIQLNRKASKKGLGVALGRVCIAVDYPVSSIATQLGVSRQTVYNWFVGLYEPKNHAPNVVAMIKKLEKYS